MQDWLQVLRLDTSATEKDRGCDVWDNDNCCNYSADGTKLLDAENYPSEVHVKDGTKARMGRPHTTIGATAFHF